MRTTSVVLVAALAALATLAHAPALRAQENYEIQVYPSELVPRGRTMVELHSNYTIAGPRAGQGGTGLALTEHAWHETIEVTHGFTEWFEVGFYFFTSARNGDGWEWVGDHIRPRLSIPASWHWPVGVSLSQEFGYARRKFSEDTWTWEIRPIIDKQMGRLYVSLNPSLERALVGENTGRGFEFSPNVAATVDVTPTVNLGLEYYGAFGPLTGFDPVREQAQQIFPTLNLNLSPDWEFNFGVGRGLTSVTERWMVKLILGRRL